MIKYILAAALLLALAVAGYGYYRIMLAPAVAPELAEPITVTIPTGTDYDGALELLSAAGVRVDRPVFDALADRMGYERDLVRPGKYSLDPGMNTVDVIRRLRNGKRGTVNVVLTTEREPMNVAAKAARFLEGDSLDFVRVMQDTQYLAELGYTPETVQSLFLPNTYELYWHATPKEFMERMVVEHDRYWNAERRALADSLGLTPAEVYTLASIVQSESLAKSEQPRIAGLYLNRLERGIPLQSDPTAVFANRIFGVRRVLYEHIELDHPYNTYVYAGLPPGPIAMPSLSAIEAVLRPEDHDYIFMCAVGDNSGLHNFAETAAGHARNKAIYVANLRRRGLR